ncbi:MAG TPA: hypothetical protein VFY10_08490, partial [Dehalococcoidia bacterium]|nr:hypothetical protein [Dehalococcoidia bacterium]
SGATIRRWESGKIQPTRGDILRFAEVCDLAPMETEFLIRTFAARRREFAPSGQSIEVLKRVVAESELPCFISDSLFYLRISSSYFSKMLGIDATENMGLNVMEILLRGGQVVQDPEENERVDYWLRSFWLMTARMAGSTPYQALLRRLRQLDGFEDRWWQMGLSRPSVIPPVNLPYAFKHPQHGTFRVLSSMLVAPPIYQVREYWPVDEKAERFVKELRRQGPPAIIAAAIEHWSGSEESADGDLP